MRDLAKSRTLATTQDDCLHAVKMSPLRWRGDVLRTKLTELVRPPDGVKAARTKAHAATPLSAFRAAGRD